MARVQAVSVPRQFQDAMTGTKEEIRQRFIAFAKSENAKVMNADPKPVTFNRFVDGKLGATEEQVKFGGFVLYRYPRLEIVAQFALETLQRISPVGVPPDDKHPGLYRDSHTILVNGVQSTDFSKWQPGEEIIITNLVPYARVIELGKMKMRVPGTEAVYQQTEKIVKRQYGNLADIRYTFRGFAGGALLQGKAHGQSDNRYPALVIREKR